MKMDKVKCINCKWYEKERCHKDGPRPVVFNEILYVWPPVTELDWCGKFIFMKKKPKTL